jgi:hypothetical protein
MRGTAVATHLRNDQCAVAEAELRAMALPDLDSLGEAERRAEPGNRLSDVRIDQHGDDRRVRYSAVLFIDASSLLRGWDDQARHPDRLTRPLPGRAQVGIGMAAA